MDTEQVIAARTGVKPSQVRATIALLDGGNTLPFIARYRKEATGGLDEEQIRQISALADSLRQLEDRRLTILETIESQGKLSPELRDQIVAAETLTALEDLYQPYKPKRRTRASIARERGLEELAAKILAQETSTSDLETIASPYLTDQVETVEDALAGARDIIAEVISDDPEMRRSIRDKALHWGVLRSEMVPGAEDPRQVYSAYYEFSSRVDLLRPYQVLALNRGEVEKVLRVRIEIAERDWQEIILWKYRVNKRSIFAGQLWQAVQDSAERLLLPAIERDVRAELSGKAGVHAIRVFADNLRALLNQPPLSGRVVLGIDPGFRTGCKVAVLDQTGKVLEIGTIYPHEPQKQRQLALQTLHQMVKHWGVTLVSIGNGTASRETEQLVVDLIHGFPDLKYIITNEAGASVYSASPLARAELPGMDVSLRGAVSIARRVQDPLAELVKIDPQSIGVGLYQHDVDQKDLRETLCGVVESVVNQVGVDVNTASPTLLTYVAGIGPKRAEAIVAYRNENGPFTNRNQIKKVPGLGPKAFEQSAGFLRIRGGAQPFDESAIHPESYPAAARIMEIAGIRMTDPTEHRQSALHMLFQKISVEKLAEEVNTGIPTLRDILDQIVRPGRDPRQDAPPPILRSDVLSMDDLTQGMRLQGTVRNVVDFGAFVDIGVKQDGLLHRSQIPSGKVLRVGDILQIVILKVEADRGRISLGWSE